MGVIHLSRPLGSILICYSPSSHGWMRNISGKNGWGERGKRSKYIGQHNKWPLHYSPPLELLWHVHQLLWSTAKTARLTTILNYSQTIADKCLSVAIWTPATLLLWRHRKLLPSLTQRVGVCQVSSRGEGLLTPYQIITGRVVGQSSKLKSSRKITLLVKIILPWAQPASRFHPRRGRRAPWL